MFQFEFPSTWIKRRPRALCEPMRRRDFITLLSGVSAGRLLPDAQEMSSLNTACLVFFRQGPTATVCAAWTWSLRG